jgi:hypothetical protein
MIPEPIISLPVICAGNQKRRQFLSTLPLRSILVILSPILQHKTKGAGLRADRLAAKKVADEWLKRGEIESIKPIVIAIAANCVFLPYDELNPGAGSLKFSFDSLLDVCDGIQRLQALKSVSAANDAMRKSEWPVHFIVVSGEDDLELVNQMIRQQTSITFRRAQNLRNDPSIAEWIETLFFKSKFLQQAVAQKKSSLSTRSTQLWAGSAVRKALREILKSEAFTLNPESAEQMAKIWDELPSFVDSLQRYKQGLVSASQIREETVLTLAPTFHALAMVIAIAMSKNGNPPEQYLQRLNEIDWSTDRQYSKMGRLEARKKVWTQRLLTACDLKPRSP